MTIANTRPHLKEIARERTSELVYYRDAEQALKDLDVMLGKSHSDARDSILKLMHLLLNKGRRVVLYLGAGCSVAVKAQVPKGYAEFKGKSWIDLLRGLLDTMSKEKQDEFLQSLTNRAEERDPKSSEAHDIGSFLQYFDKLQVAWYLSSRFPELERDEEIRKLVEPPVKAKLSSPLHEQLIRLPFDDIVTTNYDSLIARFLRRGKKNFTEITNSKDLISFQSEGSHRLFYLHGKAGQSRLIFDRFDYAELLAERDGILDYVTYLLMDSHVIYVGFGLDDPTFNLMETRLHTLHGVYRPQSFAFILKATEIERTAWRKRKLDIIDYEYHNNLPRILECINTTIRFIGWAEPERPKDEDPKKDKKDRTKGYMAKTLYHYVRGEFKESLLEGRAALASTLFWERQPAHDLAGTPTLPFDKAARLCEIRIRMALNHYKLQWTPGEQEVHKKALDENKNAARSIIKEQWERLGKEADVDQLRTLRALENSLDVLEGRVLYQADKLKEARRIYEGVVRNGQLEIPKAHKLPSSVNEGDSAPPHISHKTLEERDIVLWQLKYAESYFYAKCQLSRIAYQFPVEKLEEDLGDRVEQVGLLDKLVKEIEEFREFIATSEPQCKTIPEWDFYRNSIGILHRIAAWTAGRHAVGTCRDVIPTQAERCEKNYDKLSAGIDRLEKDPVKDENIKWEMSQRWFVLRYRYLCRGYALRWVVGQNLDRAEARSDADLVDAYKNIQMALQVAERPGLERERMVNLFEAARLNILAMFGERIGARKQAASAAISPLSFGAGLYYLDAAFRVTDRDYEDSHEAEKKREIGWLKILGFRIASYFAIVAGQGRKTEIERVSENTTLYEFLSKDIDDMRDYVANAHRQFAESQGDPAILDKRIEYYQKGLEAIREEIKALE